MSAVLEEVFELSKTALETITSFLHKTPLISSESISSVAGTEVFLKLANLQKPVHSRPEVHLMPAWQLKEKV